MWPLLLGAAAVAAYVYFSGASGSDSALAALGRKPKVGEVITLSLKEALAEGKAGKDWGTAGVKVLNVGEESKTTDVGDGKIAMGGILDGLHKGKYVLIVYNEPSADRPKWSMARPADVRLTAEEKSIVQPSGAPNEYMISAPGSRLEEVGRAKNIADSALVTAEPAGYDYRIVRVVRNPTKFDVRAGDLATLYSRGADGAWVEEIPPV